MENLLKVQILGQVKGVFKKKLGGISNMEYKLGFYEIVKRIELHHVYCRGWNQEWLCWRRPAAVYTQNCSQWLVFSHQPAKTEAVEHRSNKGKPNC
jgi:hypothetical protein